MNIIITIILILFNILAIYAVVIEPHWIEMTTNTVPLPDDLKALAGTRIVHLSDIHIQGKLGPYERRIINMVNTLRPDIVCITGDLISHGKNFGPALTFIESFTPRDRTYCTLGNSDYEDISYLGDLLRHRPIAPHVELLRNQYSYTEINGVPITIAGIDDPVKDYADPGMFNELKKYPGFKIALIHAYLEYPNAETGNAHLILSGHTHGGQINILPHDLMLRFVRYGYECKIKYLDGFHKEGETWVNVSRGLGLSALPVRFRARPEISVIDLVK